MDPNISVQQTPPVAEPIVPSVPKQSIEPKASFSKWTVLILLIVFVFLLSIAGYFFLNESKIQHSQTTTTSIKPTITKPKQTRTLQFTPLTASESANWKTFVNNKYNFSIKYPSDYEFIESGATGNMLNFYDLNYKFGQGDILWIGVYKDNIDNYVNNLKGDKNYYLVKYNYNKGKIVEYRAINGDNSVIKKDKITFVSYFIQNNGYLFEIYIKGWNDPQDNNDLNDSGIFHEMISSLNFSSQTSQN